MGDKSVEKDVKLSVEFSSLLALGGVKGMEYRPVARDIIHVILPLTLYTNICATILKDSKCNIETPPQINISKQHSFFWGFPKTAIQILLHTSLSFHEWYQTPIQPSMLVINIRAQFTTTSRTWLSSLPSDWSCCYQTSRHSAEQLNHIHTTCTAIPHWPGAVLSNSSSSAKQEQS